MHGLRGLCTTYDIVLRGLPVGAYGERRDMMLLVVPTGPMYQVGTLSGNPLTMAVGIVTLQELQKQAA